MKKSLIIKIVIAVVITAVVAVAGFFAIEIFGNPVTKMIINGKADEYISETYDFEYEYEKCRYDFKTAVYYITVTPKGYDDFSFRVCFDSKGNVYDDYFGWSAGLSYSDKYSEEKANQITETIGYTPEGFQVTVSSDAESELIDLFEKEKRLDIDVPAPKIDISFDINENEKTAIEAAKEIHQLIGNDFDINEYHIDVFYGQEEYDYNTVTVTTEELI